MSDGILLPASGQTALTDDCGSGHAQIVKMAVSADADGTPIPATAAKGLYTDPHGSSKIVTGASSGLTIATTLYTAGDMLGGLVSFSNAVRSSGGTGRIDSAHLSCSKPLVLAGVDLWLFSSSVTAPTDNAQANVSDADLLKLVPGGIIEFRSPKNTGTNAVLLAVNPVVVFECVGGTTLYGVLVTQVNHTVHFDSATDISVVLGIAQD